MAKFDAWATPEALEGAVLDQRYEVVQLLGVGGMGAVYAGRHIRLDKRVAVKVLSPALAADETSRKRFLREARAANRIEHKNVVDILDFGEEPVTFFVMEYLEVTTSMTSFVAKEPSDGLGRVRLSCKSSGPSKKLTQRGSSIATSSRRTASCLRRVTGLTSSRCWTSALQRLPSPHPRHAG